MRPVHPADDMALWATTSLRHLEFRPHPRTEGAVVCHRVCPSAIGPVILKPAVKPQLESKFVCDEELNLLSLDHMAVQELYADRVCRPVPLLDVAAHVKDQVTGGVIDIVPVLF